MAFGTSRTRPPSHPGPDHQMHMDGGSGSGWTPATSGGGGRCLPRQLRVLPAISPLHYCGWLIPPDLAQDAPASRYWQRLLHFGMHFTSGEKVCGSEGYNTSQVFQWHLTSLFWTVDDGILPVEHS